MPSHDVDCFVSYQNNELQFHPFAVSSNSPSRHFLFYFFVLLDQLLKTSSFLKCIVAMYLNSSDVSHFRSMSRLGLLNTHMASLSPFFVLHFYFATVLPTLLLLILCTLPFPAVAVDLHHCLRFYHQVTLCCCPTLTLHHLFRSYCVAATFTCFVYITNLLTYCTFQLALSLLVLNFLFTMILHLLIKLLLSSSSLSVASSSFVHIKYRCSTLFLLRFLTALCSLSR